jgi:hypothetical protein
MALKEVMCDCTASCSAGYSDFEEEGCLNDCSLLNVSNDGFILFVLPEADVEGIPARDDLKNFQLKVFGLSIFTVTRVRLYCGGYPALDGNYEITSCCSPTPTLNLRISI